jgi:hypothetical protein
MNIKPLLLSLAVALITSGQAPLPAIDCTGARDSTAALQARIDNTPDAGTVSIPINCTIKLSRTITITDRMGVQLVSPVYQQNFGGGQSPKFVWTGKGGVMFSVQHSDHPVFQGLGFFVADGSVIDKFIDFDGEPGRHIGTSGLVRWNTFNASNQANPKFKAVSLSETAANNHENYTIERNTFGCSNSAASKRASDGAVVAGSPLLTASGSFTAADVGKRVRVSYAEGILDTTIRAVTDRSHVTLASNAVSTQTNATVHVGQAYGVGIYVGNSQNAKHHKFDHVTTWQCEYGVRAVNGSFELRHMGGGSSDVGVFVGFGVTESILIDFYESEQDLRGIAVFGGVAPVTITNSRISQANQLADGFFYLGGRVLLQATTLQLYTGSCNELSKNGVIVGQYPGRNSILTSMSNAWQGCSWSVRRTSFCSCRLQVWTVRRPPGRITSTALRKRFNTTCLSWSEIPATRDSSGSGKNSKTISL